MNERERLPKGWREMAPQLRELLVAAELALDALGGAGTSTSDEDLTKAWRRLDKALELWHPMVPEYVGSKS